MIDQKAFEKAFLKEMARQMGSPPDPNLMKEIKSQPLPPECSREFPSSGCSVADSAGDLGSPDESSQPEKGNTNE